MISYEDFRKVDLRIAKIISAEAIEGSDKLLRLMVSLGAEERQIVAGIKSRYAPADLIGREIVVVINLEPRRLKGFESQGMLLAASAAEGPILLGPDKEAEPGAEVK